MFVLNKAFWACLCLMLVIQAAHGVRRIGCMIALSQGEKGFLEKVFLEAQDVVSSPKLRFCVHPTKRICPRTIFLSKKIEKNFFKPHIAKVEKERYYQTYLCYKFKNTKLCPVDGGWNAWTTWSKCPAQCGLQGKQSRTRLCNNPTPIKYGRLCPGQNVAYRTCSSLCKQKGRVEAKTYFRFINKGFPKLKKECGNGHCTYDDVSFHLKGKEKEKYWASLQCIYNFRDCPVDGGWTEWTRWTACHPVCGSGYHQRERFCRRPAPKNGGYQCIGPSYQNHHCFGRQCNKEDMVFGHYFSDWSDFSPCSESCGKYGTQSKRRKCLKHNKCRNLLTANNTNVLRISKPCYNGECPAKGGWSTWQLFEFCSARCGLGRKLHIRMCNFPLPTGSDTCIGDEVQTTICRGPCDETWDKDVKTYKKQEARIQSTSTLGDVPARGDKFNEPLVRSLEGNYTDWSKWTRCTKTCDGGFRWRERTCNGEGNCFGEIFQRQLCNTANCPVNGGWSNWLDWSICSVTCGHGVESRYRKCDNPYPRAGGTCPGVSSEERKCHLNPCKNAYLQFGDWGEWSKCSSSCGQKGTRVRVRDCVVLSGKNSNKILTRALNSRLKPIQKPLPVQKKIGTRQPAKSLKTPTRVSNKMKQKNINGKTTQNLNKGEIPYENYLQTKAEAEKLAKQQNEIINTIGKILPKSKRSKRTAPRHQKNKIQTPLPNRSNLPTDARVLTKCSAHSTKMRSRCNVRSCPVDGKWANWGSWTKCSRTCGMGVHLRERTCTDPFPSGGKDCDGSGTETAHCFSKPCPEPEDKGIGLKGKSYLGYKMHKKATPFLILYVLFKPFSGNGVIVHRFRKCSPSQCAHEVILSLDEGKPWLQIADGNFRVEVKYPNKLKEKIWHTILVSVYRSKVFMRVDDGKHRNKTVKCKGDMNFDAQMTVGWDKDKTKDNGFIGHIASLRVNFRAFSLFKDSAETKYGSPSKSVHIDQIQLEPTVAYPVFHGNNFMKLSVFGSKRFSVDLIFSPWRLSGLLLLNSGNEEDSYVFIKMKKAVLNFCFNCGKKRVCTDVSNIQPNSWYYISLVVKKTTAAIRLNNGPIIELNSVGPVYSASRHLYIGGGKIDDRYQLDATAKTHTGFVGYIYGLKINGQRVNMKGAAIMNTKGFINSMGMSYTASDVIKEREMSDVMLKCDYSYYARKSDDVDIMWFQEDHLVLPNKTKKIHDVLRGQPFSSALELVGNGHEGVYLCAVRHVGVMVVQHAFIVEEPIPTTIWSVAKEEEMGVRIVAAVLSVVFIICLILVCKYRADYVGKQKLVKVMSKLETIEQKRKSQLLLAEQNKKDEEAIANEYVDDSNLNTPRDDQDSSNVNTPRDEDTSNLNTSRDEDTSNVTTPRGDREASHYGTPGNEQEDNENYYDTIEDADKYLYEEPYAGNKNTMHEKQVFFQEFGDDYEYIDENPERDEEIKETIDDALDAIIGRSRDSKKKQRGSSRGRLQSEMDGYPEIGSDDISRTTYLQTLKSRQESMRDRSVHAAYTTDSQGNIKYETAGTFTNDLPAGPVRNGESVYYNDVIDPAYPGGGGGSVMYNVDMGQSPSRRYSHELDPRTELNRRTSSAQRTVLPNVSSLCGNRGSIIMMDDGEPERENAQHSGSQGTSYMEGQVINPAIADPPMIFKTRINVGNPNTQSTPPKNEKARLSFIEPHSYSDHRNIQIDRPLEEAQRDTAEEVSGISERDRNFVVPEAPSPPIGVSPIPPAPPPPPIPPPAPPFSRKGKK